MKLDELRRVICQSLEAIAPDADVSALDPNKDLREELDIDSMDFLNFVTALDKQLHVEIPEADYAQLSTLEKAEHYLAAKLG
jgi:acyl carrier protein